MLLLVAVVVVVVVMAVVGVVMVMAVVPSPPIKCLALVSIVAMIIICQLWQCKQVLQQQLLLKHRFLLPLCLYLCEGFGVIPIVSGLVSIANKDQ